MKDDPLAGLLESPLDNPPPPHRRRAWLLAGAAVLVAALIATVVVVWGGRDSEDADPSTTTTAAALSPGVPEDRIYAELVATNAGVFMFGGIAPTQYRNGVRFDEVWRYDPSAGEWWDVQASGGPSPRAGAAAAYDAGSGVVVVFGGAIGSCSYPRCSEDLADTWVYDPAANTWEQRFPPVSPPARHGHKLAYDAGSDRVVLFGGDTGERWLGDTWAYDSDANTWTEVPTGDGPWPVAQQAMAYDPAADRVVLWGGAEREESEVWAFDLETATWSLTTPTPAPAAAWDACLAWDAASERLLLTGGEGLTTVQVSEAGTSTEIRPRDEVWALDLEAGAWTLLGRLPQAVAAHGCAGDPESGAFLIWEGSGILSFDPATGSGLIVE